MRVNSWDLADECYLSFVSFVGECINPQHRAFLMYLVCVFDKTLT